MMSMKLIYCLLILLLVSLASAEVPTIYNRESLNIDITLSSDIDIVGSPSELRVFLYDVLRETESQKIIKQSISPSATKSDNSIAYIWTQPKNKVTYSVSSSLQSSSYFPKVTKLIPLGSTEFSEYTQPSKHIDSNNAAIHAKAQELIAGEADTMIALFKLATWVEENIQYDLSTLTEQVTQSSSWVLEHKIGVCDEITSLFIAMARSSGIPARYVSGISYTTADEFSQHWLRHGWAEVYITGAWIPYDLVYGQLGYVDATHLKLNDGIDSKHTSQAFFFEGDGNYIPHPLKIDASITSEGDMLSPIIQIEPHIASEVTPGKNTLSVVLENKNNYYVATTLYLAVPPEIKAERDTFHVLLLPNEKKTLDWQLTIPASKKGSIQTFQADVYNERNERKSLLLTVSEQGAGKETESMPQQEKNMFTNLWTFFKRFFASLFN